MMDILGPINMNNSSNSDDSSVAYMTVGYEELSSGRWNRGYSSTIGSWDGDKTLDGGTIVACTNSLTWGSQYRFRLECTGTRLGLLKGIIIDGVEYRSLTHGTVGSNYFYSIAGYNNVDTDGFNWTTGQVIAMSFSYV